MTYETADAAKAALQNLTSSGDALKTDLLNLVKQVSVHAEGAVTVLYSGEVGNIKATQLIDAMVANGENIRTKGVSIELKSELNQ